MIQTDSRHPATPISAPPCPGCGLPLSHCPCDQAPRLASRARFALLMHELEWEKPTNTGRLVLGSLEEAERFTWQRKQPDPELLRRLADPAYAPVLVFPADRPELQTRRLEASRLLASERRPLFLLLDGTWKQTRKMLRHSPYLDPLPLLSVDTDTLSQYRLRRGSGTGQLCTVEVAAELLKLLGEHPQAQALRTHFQRFHRHYLAFKSGHAP